MSFQYRPYKRHYSCSSASCLYTSCIAKRRRQNQSTSANINNRVDTFVSSKSPFVQKYMTIQESSSSSSSSRASSQHAKLALLSHSELVIHTFMTVSESSKYTKTWYVSLVYMAHHRLHKPCIINLFNSTVDAGTLCKGTGSSCYVSKDTQNRLVHLERIAELQKARQEGCGLIHGTHCHMSFGLFHIHTFLLTGCHRSEERHAGASALVQ